MRVVRCVLLTHSAATSQRHAPAPRQRCIFLKTNNHSGSARPACGRTASGHRRWRAEQGGESSGFCPPPTPPACVSLLVGVPPKALSPPPPFSSLSVPYSRKWTREGERSSPPHRDMQGAKRASGHELPPPAPCRIPASSSDLYGRQSDKCI